MSMTSIGTKRAAAAMLAAAISVPASAVAESPYPSRAITIICPFPAGGGTDIIARVIALELSKRVGQSVIVANRPGANGTIGSVFVSRAQPDGYTLLLGTLGTHGINQAAYDNIPYDAVKDFTAVTMVGRTPMLVLANRSIKANSIPELIAEAKASKSPMVYSSAGVQSVGHMAGVLFSKVANVDLTHSPYKGAAPAVVDLVGEQLPLMFGTSLDTGLCGVGENQGFGRHFRAAIKARSRRQDPGRTGFEACGYTQLSPSPTARKPRSVFAAT